MQTSKHFRWSEVRHKCLKRLPHDCYYKLTNQCVLRNESVLVRMQGSSKSWMVAQGLCQPINAGMLSTENKENGLVHFQGSNVRSFGLITAFTPYNTAMTETCGLESFEGKVLQDGLLSGFPF